jgi:hypothetical protein
VYNVYFLHKRLNSKLQYCCVVQVLQVDRILFSDPMKCSKYEDLELDLGHGASRSK